MYKTGNCDYAKAMLVVLVLLYGCAPIAETATVLAPTATVVIEPSMTPEPTATSTPTSIPRSDDPATWDLASQVDIVDENGGLIRYRLAEWQYQPAMDRLIEFFNQHAGSMDRLMSEDEASIFFDTSSSAWLGDDPSLIGFDELANRGFKWDLENNRSKNAYPKLEYLMTQDNSWYYLEWNVWGMDLMDKASSDGIYGFVERFTVAISFVGEEQPLSFYDSDTKALLNRNEFYGPVRWTFFFQYLDGQWKIVEYYYQNLDGQ